MRRLLSLLAALLVSLALLVSVVWAAGTWRVVRNVRLLTKPSSSTGQRIKTLHPPEEVQSTGGHSGDYIRVRDQAGDFGWVYSLYLEELEADEEPTEDATTPTEPTDTGAGEDASGFAIPNCPPEGRVSPNYPGFAELQQLNRWKNRMHGPAAAEVETQTLEEFLAPGPDRMRWRSTQAVRLVGWVAEVKPGSKETCNCKSTSSQYYDTHIELTRGPSDQDLPMVVEVTPQWRGLRQSQGVNWTTSGLRQQFLNRFITVTGWLTFDSQHDENAANTNQDGDNVWRQTAWEVHPITGIELAPMP